MAKPKKTSSRRWQTLDRPPEPSQSSRPVSVWARGDGPRPVNCDDLIAEIKALAVARRKAALQHPVGHDCDGCKVRRVDQDRDAVRKLAS